MANAEQEDCKPAVVCHAALTWTDVKSAFKEKSASHLPNHMQTPQTALVMKMLENILISYHSPSKRQKFHSS